MDRETKEDKEEGKYDTLELRNRTVTETFSKLEDLGQDELSTQKGVSRNQQIMEFNGNLEKSQGPNGLENKLMDLVSGYEEDIRHIPGDSFAFSGLKERSGLTFISGIAMKLPDFEDQDMDLYGEVDTQIKVTVHADKNQYADDEESKTRLLNDVKDWFLKDISDSNMIILSQEPVQSEPSYHEVVTIVLCEGYVVAEEIGKLLDSPFHQDFWYKQMNEVVTEGVCYVKDKVNDELKKRLRTHIDDLAKNTVVDYHPKSNDIVRDLVHPALYPYIRGVSKMKKDVKPLEGGNKEQEEGFDFWGRKYEDSKFQWLPTSFKITNDRKCQIQEYINNLDRTKFPDLYKDLEDLFEIFLPYFEEVWSYANAMEFYKSSEDDVELNEIDPFTKKDVNFGGQDLQIIVKIVDYQLQPDQSYEGVWHAEGMSHENVVMTGLYFLDKNSQLSGGDLRFKRAFTLRERTKVFWEVNQSRPDVVNEFAFEGFMPVGYFPTEEGYLLVFPNCHIHKVSKLINNAQKETASRRIVVFFFVNPEKKIVSTSEISPQQNDIPLATAKEYRLELMEERKYDKKKLNVRDIELCEH